MASSRTALIFLVLETLAASVSALRFEQLLAREGQTTAVCDREFVWMNNVPSRSPCKVAAEVIAPCHGGTFEVPPLLKVTDRYDRPAGSEANRCGCSWAAYNLISACTACQGNPQNIRLWTDFIQSCPPEALSDSSFYFPDAIGGLNDDVSIPAWATTDPRQWNGQTWNIQQARSIYNEGRPDVTKASALAEQSRTTTSNSSPPAGAIAGGVIGGLVIIALAAFLAYWFLKRHRAKLAVAQGIVPPEPYGHLRSPSDATEKSGFTGSGYPSFLSSTPGHLSNGNGSSVHHIPPGTATAYTSHSSAHPFSVFGTPASLTHAHVQVPYSGSPPPPPPGHSRQTSAGTMNSREEMITPFTLHRPSETSTPRKGSSVNIPSYDSPNALPPLVRGEDVGLDGTPRRGRVNPPAYSASASGSPSPPPAAHHGAGRHGANASVDTQGSFYAGVGHSASNSFSDVYTSHPMDAASASGVPEGTTVSRSEPPSSWPRDVKRRPAEDIA